MVSKDYRLTNEDKEIILRIMRDCAVRLGVPQKHFEAFCAGFCIMYCLMSEMDRLNIWQELSASQRRKRKVEMVYCPTCRRYSWAEVVGEGHRCLECGCLVEEGVNGEVES